MFREAAGYYKVRNNAIEPDKYYVLCMKNLRKPYLLRFSCKTSFLAKRYIFMLKDMVWYEILTGEKALDRGIDFSKKKNLSRNMLPCKYEYPPHINSWRKRKQYRTTQRDRIRRAFLKLDNIKQFTLKHRRKTYFTYHFSYEQAYRIISIECKINWKTFKNRVMVKPYQVKGERVFFLKPYGITFILIDRFNKKHGIKNPIKEPTYGKLSRVEIPFYNLKKPKPKSLYI